MTQPLYVYPSDRLSTRVLRLLASSDSPMTVEQIARALSVGPADRKRLGAIVLNFGNRGRLESAGRLSGVSGRPGLWTITPAARAALATGRGRPRPMNAGRRRMTVVRARSNITATVVRGSLPSRHPLWLKAETVVSRGLPQHQREDLIADLMLALLEGQTDLRAALKAVRPRYEGLLSGGRFVSLHRAAGPHGQDRLIDCIPADREHF